eukprot:s1868_g15.t1
MAPRRHRAPGRGSAPEGDEDSGSGDDGAPSRKRHMGVNPTMMNPGFGDSASHPLGWSGAGPRRQEHVPSEPNEAAASGWMPASDGAYAEFLAAAAAVPEALPRPVALHRDLRVVLNLPSADAEAEVVVVGIKKEEMPKVARRVPKASANKAEKAEDTAEEIRYDGAPGTITSDGPDVKGRWEVEATRKGSTHIVRVPGQRLFWQGAPVTVSVDSDEAKEEAGLIASERPDRVSGLWLVEIHKTLALLPANLRERRLPGFEDLPMPTRPLPLVRGVAVELCQLRAGAAYNGLSGVVLSSCPNERGRWEVAVKVPMRVARGRLMLVGFKKPAEAPAARDSAPPNSGEMKLELGDEVEIQGLVAAPKHNGKRGVIVQRVLPKSPGGAAPHRWRVKCEQGADEPVLLDLKEANLTKVHLPPGEDEPVPAEPMGLPGDGSDGRAPPMFKSSIERDQQEASGLVRVGPRRGGRPTPKRPREEASAGPLDPMQLLEQEAEEKIRWR